MCGGGAAGNDGGNSNFGDGLGPPDNSQNNANQGNTGLGPGGAFGGLGVDGSFSDGLGPIDNSQNNANQGSTSLGPGGAFGTAADISSWGQGDAIDRGTAPLGSKEAIDAAYAAFSEMSFSDRVAFGGWGPAIQSAFSNVVAGIVNNPVQTAVNFAVGLVPGVNAVVAGAKALNSLSGLFGGPTLGSMAQAAVRGDVNLGLAPGSVAAVDTTGVPGGGAFDQGGNSSGGWDNIASALDTPTQSDTRASTTPTTISSLDPRSAYGFSSGQGVDYADLSGGFGGTNTGGRGGWRAGAAAGGWA